MTELRNLKNVHCMRGFRDGVGIFAHGAQVDFDGLPDQGFCLVQGESKRKAAGEIWDVRAPAIVRLLIDNRKRSGRHGLTERSGRIGIPDV